MQLNKILRTGSPVLLLCANIFLFGPFTIYQGNFGEFDISLSTMLFYLLVPAGILLILLTTFGMALPDNLFRTYISLLFMLGILVWFQGNILVWKYGVLDGKSIDWSQDAWRGWVDGSVWVGLMILAFLSHDKICRIASVVSIVLLSLQCGYVLLTSMRHPQIWKKVSALDSPKKIFEFSTQQNVIHIILDTFQADVFQAIIDEDPQVYSALEGFTFFKETTGTSPKTLLSLPAIFSGQNYKNDIPRIIFINNIYQGKTILNVLYDQGYSIDTLGFTGRLGNGRSSNRYTIPRPYISETQRPYGQSAAFMIDHALLRSVPHVFKKYVYHDQLWFVSRLLQKQIPENMQTPYFSEIAFIRDLIEHIVVVRNTPAYKYFHFMATHLPYVVNSGCEYSGKSLKNDRENTTIQSRCFLKYLVEFLNKLKSLGIYDSSLIMIHGDHGTTWTYVQGLNMAAHLDGEVGQGGMFSTILGNVNPLLLVKRPYQKGAMIISHAQTQLTDIPATVSAILNLQETFPGQSVFTVTSNEIRERKYYYFNELSPRKYYDHLEEYVIQGPLLDKSSWRLGATYYSPIGHKGPTKEASLNNTPMKWGSIIRFGRSGNAQPYQTRGWSAPGNGFTWTNGQNASLLIPTTSTKSSSIMLKTSFAPFLVAGKVNRQTVNVLINGQKAGEWNITTRGIQELTLIIPKRFLTNADSVDITFNLPDAISPKKIRHNKDRRVLGIAFRTMALYE